MSNGHWKGRPLLSLRLNLIQHFWCSGEFWGWQFPTVQILLKVTNLRPFWIKSRPWVMMFLNDRWCVLIDPAMSLGTSHLNLFNEENLQNSKHFFEKVNCRKSRNHASFIMRPESSNMKPQSIPARRPKNRIEYNSTIPLARPIKENKNQAVDHALQHVLVSPKILSVAPLHLISLYIYFKTAIKIYQADQATAYQVFSQAASLEAVAAGSLGPETPAMMQCSANQRWQKPQKPQFLRSLMVKGIGCSKGVVWTLWYHLRNHLTMY